MLQDSADDGYYVVVIAPCNRDIIGPIERVDTVDYNHRHKLRIRIFRLCSQAANPIHPTHSTHTISIVIVKIGKLTLTRV